MTSIVIALSKGRILEESTPLLARIGAAPREDLDATRKLVVGTQRKDVRLIVVRASDAPVRARG